MAKKASKASKKSRTKINLQKNTQTKKNTQSKVRKILTVLIIVIVLLAVLACITMWGLFAHFKNSIIQVKEINSTLNVSDYVGLNLDADMMHFGTVFPGGYAVRDINITSGKEGFIYVTAEGGLDEFIFVSQQGSAVSAQSTSVITLMARPSKEVPFGNYTSTLRFYVCEKKLPLIALRIFGKGRLLQPIEYTEEGSAKIGLNIEG